MAVDASWPSVELFVTPNAATDNGVVTDLSTRGLMATLVSMSLVNDDATFSTVGALKGSSGGSARWTGDSFLIAANQDFTVEWFFRYQSNASVTLMTMACGGADGAGRIVLYTNASGMLVFNRYAGAAITINASTPIPTGGKHHIRMSRVSGTIYFFLNGALLGSTADGSAFGNGYGGLVLICGGTTTYLSGIRFTKGVGRSTASFTAPDDTYSSTSSAVSGTVKDSAGANAARTVRLYRRDTGKLVGAAVSNASTGAYTIKTQTADEVQRVVLDDAGGLLYNDLIDRVIPS